MLTQADVRVGGQSVLASGVIVVEDDQTIDLTILGFKLRIVLTSKDRRNTERPKVTWETDGPSGVITLTDFNNPFGTAYSANIGDLDGAPVKLALMVHAIPLEKVARSLAYTVFLEAANG